MPTKGKFFSLKKRKNTPKEVDTNLFPYDDNLTHKNIIKPDYNVTNSIPTDISPVEQHIESKTPNNNYYKFLCKNLTEVNVELKSTIDLFRERQDKIEVDKNFVITQNKNLKQKLNLMYICMIIVTILQAFVVACFAVMR
jgi:hypothetical protein